MECAVVHTVLNSFFSSSSMSDIQYNLRHSRNQNKTSLLGACEPGLFEEVAADQRLLAHGHQACQLQAHQQVDASAKVLLLVVVLEVLVYVRTVVLRDFLEELVDLCLLQPGLLYEERQLRLDPQLVADVLPADIARLLPDFHGRVLDDLGDLVLELVLGSDVLLGVDAQLVGPRLLLLLHLLAALLLLVQVLHKFQEPFLLPQVFLQRFADGLDYVQLLDQVLTRHSAGECDFVHDCLLGNGVNFLFVEDDLQHFFIDVLDPRIVLELIDYSILDEADQLLKLDVLQSLLPPVEQEKGAFEAVHEPPAALVEGNGVEVDVADERQYFGRKVWLDGLVNEAVVHVLAEKVLRVVELVVVLFEVLKAALVLGVEVVESAEHSHKLLVLQSLLEAIDVLLIQVSDRVGDEDYQFKLRVFFQVDVHVQHYLSHLRLRQYYHVDSLSRDVLEDAALLCLEFVPNLPQEGLELYFLVLAELYGEDLVVEAVLVLVVALPNDVIHGRVQILVHQLFFDPLAGPELAAELDLPPVAVALRANIHKLLLFRVLHLEVI